MWKLWNRTRHAARRSRRTGALHSKRLDIEALEERTVPSWTGVPPASIVPPLAAGVSLNSLGDAQGSAAISFNEVDYYTFIAPASGSYRLSATTPTSNVDTVLGVFNAAGTRIAYNDDTAF